MVMMLEKLKRYFLEKKSSRVLVVKPRGYEDLIQFFERIANDLSGGRYGDFVVVDCGEEIRVIADIYSTPESINRAYEKEFLDGFEERFKRFEDRISKFHNEKEIV